MCLIIWLFIVDIYLTIYWYFHTISIPRNIIIARRPFITIFIFIFLIFINATFQNISTVGSKIIRALANDTWDFSLVSLPSFIVSCLLLTVQSLKIMTYQIFLLKNCIRSAFCDTNYLKCSNNFAVDFKCIIMAMRKNSLLLLN